MSGIIGFLINFDLFAEKPSLTLFKKRILTSFTGFLTTLALVAVIFVFSLSKLNSVIYRTKSSIESEERIDLNTPQIDLRNRFALMISPEQYNSLSGKRYFDFYFAIRMNIMDKDGNITRNKQVYKLIPCQYQHFPMFEHEDLEKIGIKNWLCPNYTDSSLDFNVKGAYGEEIYKFLELGILKCSNNSYNNPNDSCASEKEIKQYTGKFYFNMMFINNLLNLDNFNQPITSYVETIHTMFNLGPYFVQNEYYFDNIEIKSDLTQIMNLFRTDSNVITESHLFYDDKYDFFTANELTFKSDQNLNQIYASIYLRASKKNRTFWRKYDTFQDVLETAGSYYSIFFLLFAFIHSKLTKNQLIEKIALTFYDCSEKTENDKALDSLHETSNKLLFFIKYFFNKVILFISTLFKKKNNFIGGAKFHEVESQLKNDMDIITILMKLQKFENFKKVMLNKDQHMVFEFIKKKKIVKELSERKIANLLNVNKTKLKSLDSNKKKLISIYNQALSNVEKDSSEISKKICELNKNNLKCADFLKKKSSSKKWLSLKPALKIKDLKNNNKSSNKLNQKQNL